MSDYFSLSDCDVIGFDLDHTLCRYHLKETSRLIYESFARYLVEHKGYDPDLLNLTPATWDFCFKGLVVDLEDGNLVKLAEDGTVLRPDRDEERFAKRREEIRQRSEERAGERKTRHEDIRKKYGLIADSDPPYNKFENE